MFTLSTLISHAHDVNVGSMTQSRDAYHHGDLRNALVASAVRLIEEGGVDAFSLREAARELGVSANAAYRHFDDKCALMSSVAAHGFGELALQMLRAIERATADCVKGPPSIERFKAVGRAYVEFALDHPEIFRLMFGVHGTERRRLYALDDGTDTPWTLLGKSLDALVADGVLTADRRPGAELKAWTVVHGFASLTLDGQATTSSAQECAASLESLLEFTVVGLCGEMRQ
jgi:AcrR family transcriptional regulator